MKPILVLLTILVATAAQAQVKLGMKAGAAHVNQRISNGPESSLFAGTRNTGYQAGFIGDIKLGGNFYLQPQLLWSQRGATLYRSTEDGAAKIKMHYLEVPVQLVYKIPVGIGSVLVGAGGSFSYAVAGNQQLNGQKTNLFAGNRQWKREDVNLVFTTGFEFNNGLFVSVSSQKGLLNIHRAEGVSAKNKSASVSIGYLIDWNRFKKH